MKLFPIFSPLHLLIIGICILSVSCSKTESTTDTSGEQPIVTPTSVTLTKEQFEAAEILTGKIENRVLSGSVNVTGMLDVPPQNSINITAPFGGFLRSTQLLQGMHLKKGEVIAVIENPEYIQLQQDFLDTRSQADFLEAEYKRQQELAKENVNAQKTLQKAMADATSMRARNNGLRAKLQMLHVDPDQLTAANIRSTIELHSPIKGYVTQVNSVIGAFVTPTEVIFKIVDTEHIHAELIAFERDVPRIKIGQKIRFRLTNELNERTAKVFLIGREVSADRTIRIHGHLDHEDPALIPGMYVKAVIETGGEVVNSLPEEAVVNFEEKNYILVQDSGNPMQFNMKEINIGTKEGGFVEVTSSEDFSQAVVVIKGAYKLLSQIKNQQTE
ncbi:MAG: efflux RND transporter periplasmic adaptor subunit [Bacteroidetes bacterium]|nr:efflux RND transporter periplasmic adaptor subunit [Bacteroidota bacterium]